MTKADGTLERVGGYRVVRRLATGVTSDVLLAEADDRPGAPRSVVLKLLLPQYGRDDESTRTFAQEASAYARLTDASIVRLYDFFALPADSAAGTNATEGQLVMVLEHVDGPALSRLRAMFRAVGREMEDEVSIYLAARIFSALASAHSASDDDGAMAPVVHRDVNPSNVLVTWDGEVKLADFGVAKVTDLDRQGNAGAIKGTYGYMAPEQVRREMVTPRADVYAAGIILWELLTRRRAFQRGALPEAEALRAMAEPRLSSINVTRPDIDRTIRDALNRALEPRADRRTITAEEMFATLCSVVSLEDGKQRLVAALDLIRNDPRALSPAISGHSDLAPRLSSNSPSPPAVKGPPALPLNIIGAPAAISPPPAPVAPLSPSVPRAAPSSPSLPKAFPSSQSLPKAPPSQPRATVQLSKVTPASPPLPAPPLPPPTKATVQMPKVTPPAPSLPKASPSSPELPKALGSSPALPQVSPTKTAIGGITVPAEPKRRDSAAARLAFSVPDTKSEPKREAVTVPVKADVSITEAYSPGAYSMLGPSTQHDATTAGIGIAIDEILRGVPSSMPPSLMNEMSRRPAANVIMPSTPEAEPPRIGQIPAAPAPMHTQVPAGEDTSVPTAPPVATAPTARPAYDETPTPNVATAATAPPAAPAAPAATAGEGPRPAPRGSKFTKTLAMSWQPDQDGFVPPAGMPPLPPEMPPLPAGMPPLPAGMPALPAAASPVSPPPLPQPEAAGSAPPPAASGGPPPPAVTGPPPAPSGSPPAFNGGQPPPMPSVTHTLAMAAAPPRPTPPAFVAAQQPRPSSKAGIVYGAIAAVVLVAAGVGAIVSYAHVQEADKVTTPSSATAMATVKAPALPAATTVATTTPSVASASPESPATAAPTPEPTASAAPPASAAPTPAPAASASAAPATSDVAADMGVLRTTGAAPGRRIFVDDKVVGQTPQSVTVKCGQHQVRVGSSGKTQTIAIPCGAEITVSDK